MESFYGFYSTIADRSFIPGILSDFRGGGPNFHVKRSGVPD